MAATDRDLPAEPVRRPPASAPGQGNWRQQLRLVSGLFLFLFCLSHFANHALGIISVNAMDAASRWHYMIWRNPAGEILLSLAAVVHVGLGLWRTSRRRTLKMPRWEFVQLVLALYIPWSLTSHVLVTVGLSKQFDFSPTYENMLTLLWPNAAVGQSILLIVVWAHSMIGLHFWLRLYPLYQRVKQVALAFALIVPALSLWGFIEGARRLQLTWDVPVNITEDHWAWHRDLLIQMRALVLGLVLLTFFVVLVRFLAGRFARGVAISFPGNLAVKAQPGGTLLEISRTHNVPLASVCSGRARCSTCRVKILGGAEKLPAPAPAEAAVLTRIGAAEDVRLACQIRPESDLKVQPLVAVKSTTTLGSHLQDAYHWGVEQDVTIMFVDLRNFTGMTESQFAYDVVHLLNQYLDRVSAAIRAEGGHVDKFIGDGIMAIFGMDTGAATGARQALKACRQIEKVMQALNAEKGPQFRDPIRLGVGLHLGQAILGRIGAAGAGGARTNITALGDVVNTASRLETENKAHGSFLAVSAEVIEAAGATISDAHPLDIQVRGKAKSLTIYAMATLETLHLPDAASPAPF